jgi:Skp family chaperone for outer membrane proteins
MIKLGLKVEKKQNIIKNVSFIFFVLYFLSFSFILNSCNKSNQLKNETSKVLIGRVDLRKIRDSKYYKQIQDKIYNLELEYKDQLNKISLTKNEKELKETANKLSVILENKKQEYLSDFYKNLERALITTANKENVGIILTSDSIIYGYKDLTDEIIQTLDSNKNLDLNSNLNYSFKIAYIDLSNLKNNLNLKDTDFQKLYKDKQNDILIIFDKSNVLLGGIDLTYEIQKYISKKYHTKTPKKEFK